MSFRENLLFESDKGIVNKKKRKFYIFIFILLFAAVILFAADKYVFKFFEKNRENNSVLTDKTESNHSISMEHSSARELTGVGRPISVIKDLDGVLYVCDFSGHNVRIFNPDLSLLRQLGGNGKGDGEGEFNMPHAVDLDADGNIYVTDYGNKRIQKFSKEGKFLTVLKSERNLEGPATSYFDKDFNLYVSDYGANSLIKMSKDGKFLGWIGAKSDGSKTDGWEMEGISAQSAEPGGFYKVHSAKFGEDGTMYVVDTWNNRIQRFSKEGKFLGWIGAKEDGMLTDGWEMTGTASSSSIPGGFNAPIAMDFINGGELAVLEYGNPRVQRFSKEGKFLGWFGGTEGGGVTDGWETKGLPREGSELGAFKNAYDIRVYGNLMYIADTSNLRVQIIEFHE